MNPIECGQFLAQQIACRGDIRRQHALFDQAMGIVALYWHDALHLGFVVKKNPGFSGIEIYCAAHAAGCVQYLIECMELAQMRQQIRILFTQPDVAIQQHGGHLIVGQPGLRAHNRLVKFRADDFPLTVNLQLAHHA